MAWYFNVNILSATKKCGLPRNGMFLLLIGTFLNIFEIKVILIHHVHAEFLSIMSVCPQQSLVRSGSFWTGGKIFKICPIFYSPKSATDVKIT
jgi:hypothetical protein